MTLLFTGQALPFPLLHHIVATIASPGHCPPAVKLLRWLSRNIHHFDTKSPQLKKSLMKEIIPGQMRCKLLRTGRDHRRVRLVPNQQDIRSVRAVNFVQFCKQSDVKVMRIHMAELKELEDEEETRKQFDELPVGLIEVPNLAEESFRRLVERDCTLAEAKRVFPPYFHTFLESYLGEDEAGERLRRKADEADVEKFLRVKPTLAMKDVLALLPKEFHHHAKHFLPKSAEELPPHRPWDHKIELLPGKEVPYYKNRPFSPDELRCVKKWIDEM